MKPEKNKRSGVRYAFTDDGIELPLIDVTGPPFASQTSEDEQRAAVEKFLREQETFLRLPPWVRSVMFRLFMRGSILTRAIRASDGTFLAGLATYLLKLPPDLLGSAYTVAVDRRIAAGLPALSLRLRLEDMARLAADALAPTLAREPGRPCEMFNIAGGPAMDSLNTLLLLQKEHPEVLVGRTVRVTVLDGDEKGPHFGEKALAEFAAPGAPLHGVRVAFERKAYDFRDPAGLAGPLARARAEGALTLTSSEGGLFEYGSDRDIIENLRVLREAGGAEVGVVGSVTRDDEVRRVLKHTSRAATIPRGISVFRGLCERAGFSVARVIERPLSDDVLLAKG